MVKKEETGRGKIVIIECISSSANYISDIRELGYEPVLMELWVPDWRKNFSRKKHDEYYSLNGDSMLEIISAPQDYAEVLELTKNLDPLLIIPGSSSFSIIPNIIIPPENQSCIGDNYSCFIWTSAA